VSQQSDHNPSLVQRMHRAFSRSVFWGMVVGAVVLGPLFFLASPNWAVRWSALPEIFVGGAGCGAILGIVVGTVWCLVVIELWATRSLSPANKDRVAIAIGVALCLCVFAWGLEEAYFPGSPFDPASWKDKESRYNGLRQQMAVRLVSRHVLNGKTRAEVRSMFGKPNWPSDPTRLMYFLGHERPFLSFWGTSSRCEWLTVEFGPDDRVSGCHVGAVSHCGCVDEPDEAAANASAHGK
jgi:hypothetical protein